jgi:hypothetical protein
VAQLVKPAKQHDLAYRITRDYYLEPYAWNLNQFIAGFAPAGGKHAINAGSTAEWRSALMISIHYSAIITIRTEDHCV